MRTEHAGQLAGVVAHEVGHIAGGHLSRVGGAQRRAAAEMILATVLGAAAAVAGAPALGTAIISGGQSYAQSGLMRFSRSQEQSADQAAISYLDRVGHLGGGLAEFFKSSRTRTCWPCRGATLTCRPTRSRAIASPSSRTGLRGDGRRRPARGMGGRRMAGWW